MTFDDQDITAIRSLGYTSDEAQFLYLVAVHSGYFVPRQFLAFTGTQWGKRSHGFTAKLESRGHVTWREYDRTGGVYHLFSKTIYRFIGKENLRNRRRHSLEFIRTRLVLLDFVLANLHFNYLETESEKVSFFCDGLGISKKVLPSKSYEGGPRTQPTLRYFVDKFPLYVEKFTDSSSPVVTFSYVDPGQASLAGFAHHLYSYLPLLRQLQNFSFRYIANSRIHFDSAERCFRSVFQTNVSGDTLRYFRLRQMWEQKKYGSLSTEDTEWLNQATQRFYGERFERSYLAWVRGELSEQTLRNEFEPVDPLRRSTFSAYLVLPSRVGKKLESEKGEGPLHPSSSSVASPRTSPLR